MRFGEGVRRQADSAASRRSRFEPKAIRRLNIPLKTRVATMTYGNKKHRNTNQLKSRLNDEDHEEFSIEAQGRGIQPGVLARNLILKALQFKRDYGYFPLVDDHELAGFPALSELARELKVQPSVLARDLIRAALLAKQEQDTISGNDKKRSA
ncbi:MAG: hypothetical protein ACOH2R_08390 [Pseudomonas sp.]